VVHGWLLRDPWAVSSPLPRIRLSIEKHALTLDAINN
jgi:hypothetical protein